MQMIIELYKKYKEILNYIIFGGLTTLVNLIVKYLLLFTILNAEKSFELQIAVVVSWIVAVTFAYITNRKFVFESENKNKIKEFSSFILARIVTLLLEMFIMWLLITVLKLNTDIWVIVITLFAQAVVIVSNYVFSKLLVFRKNKM